MASSWLLFACGTLRSLWVSSKSDMLPSGSSIPSVPKSFFSPWDHPVTHFKSECHPSVLAVHPISVSYRINVSRWREIEDIDTCINTFSHNTHCFFFFFLVLHIECSAKLITPSWLQSVPVTTFFRCCFVVETSDKMKLINLTIILWLLHFCCHVCHMLLLPRSPIHQRDRAGGQSTRFKRHSHTWRY